MVQIKCSGEFVYEGNKWSWAMRRLAERFYFKAHNLWADIFNSHIEEFNSEWEALFPEIENIETNSPEWFAYNKFIADKMDVYDRELNSRELRGSLFEIHTDPKTAVFNITLRGYPDCRMYLELIDFDTKNASFTRSMMKGG